MVEPLRSRLVAASLPRVFTTVDGAKFGVPRTAEQAAGVALLVVDGWLSDLLDDLSWVPTDPYALEDHRNVVRRTMETLIEMDGVRE